MNHSNPKTAVFLAAGIIVLAGVASYAGSFSGAMLYDDIASIVDNPALRHLAPWAGSLAGPAAGGLTVSGRPLLQFSLAANYALGGAQVWGYHAVNLAIHLLAGLVLFGLVRRTLERLGPAWRSAGETAGPKSGGWNRSLSLAFAAALLWTVHPLQTEAVTYIVQRAESLMGLFYLLTLYGFVRSVAGEGSQRGWAGVAVLCCLLGMATKEVMATAPLMVLLYDRTFVAGSCREAWRRRRGFYASLAATWLLLAYLVFSTGGNRGGTAGFGVAVSGWAYGLTQFQAVARYLGLALWPHPLVFEYGPFWVRGPGDILPYALVVVPLLAATVWALLQPLGRAARAAGFLGAWFFGILAPSSLTPGTMQMIVEHRMYLPLAAVLVALVCGLGVALDQLGAAALPRFVLLLALAGTAGFLTFRRNETYQNPVTLWQDTVAKRPGNPVAVYNLGVVLDASGQFPAAAEQFFRAARLRPDLPAPRYDLGYALFQMGRVADAVRFYTQALRLDPRSAMAHNSLGVALARLGRPAEAIAHYEEALRLEPGYARAEDNLGNALLQMGRLPEAEAHYARAVQLDPVSAVAHYNLANALARLGRPAEAVGEYEAVLRLRPDDPGVRAALARARQAMAEGTLGR